MILHGVDDFTSKGSMSVPNGEYVAVGIAPNSIVDVCTVGPYRLGPMSIVPMRDGEQIKAVRLPFVDTGENAPALPKAVDGNDAPCNYLAVWLYGPRDVLVPPGPRAPFTGGGNIKPGASSTSASTALLLCRIPFMGRKHAVFGVTTQFGNPDMNVVFRGIKYATTPAQLADLQTSVFADEPAVDTYFQGAASAPLAQVLGNQLVLARTWHLGGGGDLEEAWDEVQVFAWTAGTGNQPYYFWYEAFGERNR